MNNNERWGVAKVRAWAEINGAPIEIAGCVIDFGVNEIPQCSLVVAAGSTVPGGQKAAIHDLQIRSLIPAKVYAEITPTAGGAAFGVPKGPTLIFDGYTTYAGYRKVFGRVAFVVNLSHWMVKLGFSSILSEISSPTNPIHISYPASLPPMGSAAGGVPADAPTVQLKKFISAAVTTDLWGHGIKNFFVRLCSAKRFDWRELQNIVGACAAGDNIANSSALEALNRFEGGGVYNHGVPLKLKAGANAAGVSTRISFAIGAETTGSLATTTMWDKLIGDYAQNYRFAVIPLVNNALVVPFTPGLRQTVGGQFFGQAAIKASEIAQFDMSASIPRPVRGIGLTLSQSTATGGLPGIGSFRTALSGALYDTCGDGVILYLDAPAWIANLNVPQTLVKKTTVDTTIPINQLALTGIPTALDIAAAGISEANLAKDMNLWRSYAHSLYVQEVLRHRQGQLAGRLRFDIAPGSSVSIEVPEDRFIQAQGRVDELRGTVLRVTTTLNSEEQQAGTAYQIGFLRTPAEDGDDKTSVSGHPIWETNWYGAPLVG